MKSKVKYLFVIAYCFVSAIAFGQKNTATAALDTNVILIGDQVSLRLSFLTDTDSEPLFPFVCDTCLLGIDIIERSEVRKDTVSSGIVFNQNIILTAFDSGEYAIPAFDFLTKDSAFLAQTMPLMLRVRTVSVDTTQVIKDIKPPLKVPITIQEILPYLLGVLLIAVIVGLGIFFLLKIKRKKKNSLFEKPKPKIPAHEIALKALEELRTKKLWQQGEIKQYYSELTDILRVYMENRWDINAMEMVSDEILEALNNRQIEKSLIDKIRYLLACADMAKFAKGEPLPDENNLCFQYVADFVNATKQNNLSENTSKKKI